MNDSMNDPAEAERQWWGIEFEMEYDPDKLVWVSSDHKRCDCPDCQRILQDGTQPKKKKRSNSKLSYDYVRDDLRQRRK